VKLFGQVRVGVGQDGYLEPLVGNRFVRPDDVGKGIAVAARPGGDGVGAGAVTQLEGVLLLPTLNWKSLAENVTPVGKFAKSIRIPFDPIRVAADVGERRSQSRWPAARSYRWRYAF